MRTKLRRATDEDAQAIAEVYFESFRLLTFLPMLHTAEGYRRFIANVILKECAVTVVEDDTGIVSHPYPAGAGCATAAGGRRTRSAPPGMVPVLS